VRPAACKARGDPDHRATSGDHQRPQQRNHRALALDRARHTIDVHLKHIYVKVNIHSRAELAVLTLQHRTPA
jgi:hypothetical protein